MTHCEQINTSLKTAIGKLIEEVQRNEQLVGFKTDFQKRKIYDLFQKKYIDNQKLKKEVGAEYESSDSEDESDIGYNCLSRYQMKCLMKDHLLLNHFDPEELSEVNKPGTSEGPVPSSVQKFAEEEGNVLNVIAEEKYPPQKEVKNMFALNLLIEELEKINQANCQQNISEYSNESSNMNQV